MATFRERLAHAWNAFTNQPTSKTFYNEVGPVMYDRMDRKRFSPINDQSIITAIFTRIAVDAAAIDIKHVKLDENDRYLYEMDSKLNECLSLSANIDQTGRDLIRDAVMSLCDDGVIAIVPVDVTLNPTDTTAYDILSLRVGKIVGWHPKHVKVLLYNELVGKKEEILVPKTYAAIIENPFYNVMNEPNSILKRLLRKMVLLDAVDEQSSSGKLDVIIQLPYTIRSDMRKNQAEERRKDIEVQLTGSKYGIAYIDATEKVTQLNRPVENNLLNQIEYLTKMLYNHLGITDTVLNGTADEKTMLNYYSRIIEPILSAICEGMERTFLTKTARTQHQSIKFFRDPFKLVPVNDVAEIADKFTRNEILSSNEVRSIVGYKPVDDARADELRNKNLNENTDAPAPPTTRGEEMVGDILQRSAQ